MSTNNRREDVILQALLTCRTISEAAQVAKVSERLIYKLLKNSDFEVRYRNAREDILRGVSNQLKENMSKAVETIASIMNDTDNRPNERLSAAKTILEYGNKYIELENILERLKKLEDSQSEEL